MKKNFVSAILSRKFIAAAVFGLASVAVADNPISTYHYLADPSAASDGDTFYILTDTDDMCVSDNPFAYDIIGLYAFSSQDMKNWTDHGMIFESKREFDYVGNTWASGIAVKDGRVFIVYPDGASSVGMITAPSIDGPYTNPLPKNKLAGPAWANAVVDCDGVAHCFDPGIFFDDDGSGYVIFGGGENAERPYGNNFTMYKFSESNGKVTLDLNSKTRVQAPKSFEAPYIHKNGDWYYLSFNNQSQEIGYGMSKSPTGPYDYKGIVIGAVWQINDCETASCDGGNNHQGFAKFKDKTYAVYHDRRLVRSKEHPASLGVANPEPGNHRSVSIDEITYAADGSMNKLNFTKEGPKQIKNFDPYRTYKALTSSKQRNVRSRTDWTKGEAVKHVLTPLATKTSWIRVSGVDFGNGAQNLRIKAANVGDGNKIEIRKGSETGTLAGTCELAKTSGWQSYTDNDCDLTGLTGIVDELFFVFKGTKDSTMGILEWEFQGTKREPEPQTPFKGVPFKIPGIIQMEDFDVPGYGVGNDSYYDDDKQNHSCTDEGKEAECTDYRDSTGVDLYKKAKGNIVVGYIKKGEWLEYTVDVAKDGDYTVYAAVASDGGSSFKLSMDGEDITTEDIVVPAAKKEEGDAQNFDDYNKVSANVTLTAGKHILRFTATADWFDIDYINFVSGKDAVDDAPLGEEPNAIGVAGLGLNVVRAAEYNVFDIQGQLLGTVDLAGKTAKQALNAAGFSKGVYMLKQVNGSKLMKVNSAR